MMNIPLGDFNRGARRRSRRSRGRASALAPNICYEDLFGEELARAASRDAAAAPTIFVNVSNIALVRRHRSRSTSTCRSARMRALEFERPMIRATNTGATAIIDHHGRVTHALPRLHARRADGRGRGPHRHHAVRRAGLSRFGLCAAVARWRWPRSCARRAARRAARRSP